MYLVYQKLERYTRWKERSFHYPHLLSRAVILISIYHGGISRSEFYVFYKRLGDQIEHEQKNK